MFRDKLQGVYVVTDSVISPGRSHLDITAAVAGHVGCIQLRDKDISDQEFLEVAHEMQQLLSGSGSIFIVNDRVSAAVECTADGLHIGQGDMPVAEAKSLIGPNCLLGVSVGTVDEAIKAEAEGADYIGLGPIFATATKSDAGCVVGLETIAEVRRAVGIPIVAIGGISLANIADVATAGAHSAAVISAIVCAADMAHATELLNEEFIKGSRI